MRHRIGQACRLSQATNRSARRPTPSSAEVKHVKHGQGPSCWPPPCAPPFAAYRHSGMVRRMRMLENLVQTASWEKKVQNQANDLTFSIVTSLVRSVRLDVSYIPFSLPILEFSYADGGLRLVFTGQTSCDMLLTTGSMKRGKPCGPQPHHIHFFFPRREGRSSEVQQLRQQPRFRLASKQTSGHRPSRDSRYRYRGRWRYGSCYAELGPVGL